MELFELAYSLGGRSVYEITSRPWDEVMGWFAFFEKRPPGWREDNRTFKILQSFGAKDKPWEHFPSLGPIYNSQENRPEGMLHVGSLKKSPMFMRMLNARGGDKLEIFDGPKDEANGRGRGLATS